ncbi:MAG: DUF5667 domain-containing protein [Patescibacteria group bacterium]
MKKILLAIIVLAIIPQALYAQTTATTTSTSPVIVVVFKNPGLVSGDFFYFADRWIEALNEFITFREESIAKLALEHAQERASEIAVILKTKGALSDEVKNTKQDFDDDIEKASEILKAQGREENNEDIELSNKMLKQAYREYRKSLKETEKKLNEEFRDAVERGDSGLKDELEEKIKRTKEEKDIVRTDGELEDEDIDEDEMKDGNEEDDNNASEIGDKKSAEVHIENATRAREQFIALAKVQGTEGSLETKNILATFDTLLLKAKTALVGGDMENAKEYAKDATKVLDDGREDLNNKQLEDDFFKDRSGR